MSAPALQFVPATREQVYARLCLVGPGGSGKTYTGLTAMTALCGGLPFGVVDTERGRIKKYVGVNGWQFHIVTPTTFSPDSLTEILGVAAGAGLAGVMIDSGSLYWDGQEGMLEQVDKASSAASRSDKFSSGWKVMKPSERRMWDAILAYPGHVVMTLRTKVAYVVEDVEKNGRTVKAPRKVGLKPVQRDEFEYEFDLVGELDQANSMTITKSDVPIVPQGTTVDKPGPVFFEAIGEFCSDGIETAGVMAYRTQAVEAATEAELRELLTTVTRFGLRNAPITDELGQPTVLGDLIIARGRAMHEAATAAARAANTAAAPAAAKPLREPTPARVTANGVTPAGDPWDARIKACGTDKDAFARLWRAAPEGEIRTRIANAATEAAKAVKAAAEPIEAPPAGEEASPTVDEAREMFAEVVALTSAATPTAAGVLHEKVATSKYVDHDVSRLLDRATRETLGIDNTDPVTLAALAALVLDYVDRHGYSIETGVEGGPAEQAIGQTEGALGTETVAA